MGDQDLESVTHGIIYASNTTVAVPFTSGNKCSIS